ncbi:MAG: hypothetical protein M3R38_11815 [Actinomycetota bacterium]|nr:hypothetical protein [Actinomycetota bacterium]
MTMQRAVHLAMVVFWTSAPLLGVCAAVPWPQRFPEWPVVCLWFVVVASSAFLTLHAFPIAPGGQVEYRGHGGRTSEALVYPVVFFLSLGLFSRQLFP